MILLEFGKTLNNLGFGNEERQEPKKEDRKNVDEYGESRNLIHGAL